MDNNDNLELFKGGRSSDNNDLTLLREKFKNDYASKKGWNINNLSEEQITEIKSQKGYQCPGMICG